MRAPRARLSVNFADRLQARIEARGNPCLVGLDPHLDLLPPEFAGARDLALPRAERARCLADFCCAVIDVVASRVAAVKPQSAFFEVLGADGVAAWERVVRAARDAELLVIGDVKRGDIASTASAYASAFLEGPFACDAITLNPLLGGDSVEPFLRACARTDAGLYVLVRTSNPGSADFQRHGTPELSFAIARQVARWGSSLMGACGLSSIGAVVGATHGSELREFRAALPPPPFLLPGYGAQGASARDLVDAFVPHATHRPFGALVNSSRGITFAWREREHAGLHWKDATRAALDKMIVEIDAALSARR